MIDYLIIGNGVAGIKAAETIRNYDKTGSINIISDEEHNFYYRPQLPRFIANKVEERALFGKSEQFYKDNNIARTLSRRVVKVLTEKDQVILDNGEMKGYRRLLLATGGSIRQKEYPGSDKTKDIIGLKTIKDAKIIKDKIKDSKQALVVGDSFLATYMVEALKEAGLSVTYIIRSSRIFPDLIDADASKILEMRLQLKGVRILKGTDIKEIVLHKGAIRGVHTIDHMFIECQVVGIADGLRPNIGSIVDSAINIDNGIVVDDGMRTNIPNVFAAGDVTQFNDGHSEMPHINVRWLKAWKQGIVAGKNMAGMDEKYDDLASFASTQIYSIDLASLGISNPVNGKYKIIRGEYPHPETDVYKKLVLEDDRIVGGLLVGDVQEATALMKAIVWKKKIDEVDKRLIKQMFDLNYRISPYHGIICPVCKLQIALDANVKEGDIINCPACGIEIRVKDI